MNQLTNEKTLEILQRAQHKAREISVNVCIALVDAGGHLLAFQRMDGAKLGPVDLCQRKARTSALFLRDSGLLGDIIRENELVGFELSNGGLAAFPGGLPIFADDNGEQLLGAIGVSGGTPAQDREIASYAIELS